VKCRLDCMELCSELAESWTPVLRIVLWLASHGVQAAKPEVFQRQPKQGCEQGEGRLVCLHTLMPPIFVLTPLTARPSGTC
jgi:hypothetical protein